MFCSKCGAENIEGAKFCKSCGCPLGNTTDNGMKRVKSVVTERIAQLDIKKVDMSKIVEKIKTLPKNILVGTASGVIALIVLICIITNSASTINLDKYVIIETTGYDGYGKAKVSIDWDAIEEKYGNKMSFKSKAKGEYGDLFKYWEPIDVLEEYIDVEISERNYLSNGDEIEYILEIDSNLSEYIKCKIKGKGGTYIVSNLGEVEMFDPFADIKVSFEGIAPNGKMNYEYSGEELGRSNFSCSETSGLENGDSVIISIGNTDMEYYVQKYGMIPDKFEQVYVVSGLDEYASSYENLTSDFVSKLKMEAEDTIYAYAAKDYYSTTSLTDLQYVGYIFNYVKDVNRYYDRYNNIYMIYSGMVSNSDGKFDSTKVYFPVRFTNIINGKNGLSYDENGGIEGYSNLGNSWYTTYGYTNPLICYIEIVEENSDDYLAEAGDGFEVYAQYDLISGLDDISSAYKEILYADAKERIENYIASAYDYSNAEVTDLKVLGEYLLIAKNQGIDFEKNNKYIVVCSATVSHSKGRFDTTTVYFPVEYDGLVKLPKDEYIYTSVEGIWGRSSFGNSWYYTAGYVSGTEMFSKVITANRENYKYEISDSLKEFGE